MKQTILAAALIGLMFSASTAGAQNVKAVKRVRAHNTIEQRIEMGIRNGSITKSEARQLRQMQLDVQKLKRMAKADGIVTLREKQMIRNAQQRLSKAVDNKIHNKARDIAYSGRH